MPKLRLLLALGILLTLSSFLAKPRPTLYLIGDSTVRNTGAGQQGWG